MWQRKPRLSGRRSESPALWLISSPAPPGVSATPGAPEGICCLQDHLGRQGRTVTAFSLVPAHHPHYLGSMTYLLPSHSTGRSSKKCPQDPECLPLTLRALHRLSRCTTGITWGSYTDSPGVPQVSPEGPALTIQVYRRYHLKALHRPSRCTTGIAWGPCTDHPGVP